MTDLDSDVRVAEHLLPAWFIPRMMSDCWNFGLLLETGHLLCIERIDKVSKDASGQIWLDVTMLQPIHDIRMAADIHNIGALNSRDTASVNASKVVLALELADA